MSESIRAKQERVEGYTDVHKEIEQETAAARTSVRKPIPQVRGTLRQERERAEIRAEHQKEQEQREFERTAPLRAAERQFRETANAVARAERELARQTLFTQPSEVLDKCKQYVPDPTKPQSPEEVTADIQNAVSRLKLELSEQGVTLEQPSMRLFKQLLDANPTVDSRDVTVWRAMYSLLDSLDMFTAHDRTIVRQPVAVETLVTERTRETVQTELDAIHDTRNPADRRRLQKLRTELLVLEAGSGIWSEFCQFIRANYDPFGVDEQKRCTTWLGENNLLMNAANLNRYRVARGWLTNDERLAEQISNDPRSASDYSFKTDVRNNQRELSQQK